MSSLVLPARFVGFLVGQFMHQGIFNDASEAQVAARRIVESWNKQQEAEEAQRLARELAEIDAMFPSVDNEDGA